MQQENRLYDAVIIGGGPAGVSCAVWLARLGFAPVLVEAGPEIGGLCRRNPFHDDWNASLPGLRGEQVADNLALSLEQARVPVLLSLPVTHIEPEPDGYVVQAGSPALQLRAPHVVLATGVVARGLPGYAGQAFDGILVGPGVHVVAQDFAGLRVAVLGGGDNAFENALYALDRDASAVDLYARSVRAQRQFVQRFPTQHVRVGDYSVDPVARTVNGKVYDLILVLYGWEPCVHFAENLALRRSARGYVEVDPYTAETSCPGIYAVGEVSQRQHPCVVTALADGVTAAKAIQARLEAALGA